VVVLLNDNHKQLWDITANKLPPPARERIKLFRTAGATLLFYIDTRIVAQLDKAFPEYIGMFEKWENESNAMLQFQIWVGLSNLGYGVNLQHYNKLIEEDVTNAFDIPTSWELVAQMPIGKSLGELPKLHPLEKIERVITRID
jgi:predicted oxidoreductase (fatty acid repression mutant protein)